ncbi:MAG: magnesium-dependent phosphatase-1 [Thermoprotei archaeon]|nr:MAG: magnesium-dependent phosphatase-1 [Thermoprotei archaeon]
MGGGRCGYWVLFLDLDRTLWDHHDISSLSPPFKRVSPTTIEDSAGVRVRLHNDVLRLVRWARSAGAVVSTLSWNDPSKAMAAIRTFGLEEEFDYFVIEPSPDKGSAALRLVEELRRSRGCVPPPCAIVYIDDRDIHIDGVRERLGDVAFLMIWRDFSTFEEGRRLVSERLRSCGYSV